MALAFNKFAKTFIVSSAECSTSLMNRSYNIYTFATEKFSDSKSLILSVMFAGNI